MRLGVEQADTRPALIAEQVGTIDLDDLKLPSQAPGPVDLKDVGEVRSPAKNVSLVAARCLDLSLTATPPAAVVTVEGGEKEGVARVELSVDGKILRQWVWLRSHELKSVVFTKLSVSGPGPHRVRCGELVYDLPAGKR